MKRLSKRGIVLLIAICVGVAGLSVTTSTPADAYWIVKCDSGWTLQTTNDSSRFRCRKRAGTKFIYKAGKCYVPTPYLTKHTHLGFNYSCGVQVGTTTVWNKFRCLSQGYNAIKNATAKSKTCRKAVPKYSYKKPTF